MFDTDLLGPLAWTQLKLFGDELREAIAYREGGASWLAIGQIMGRHHHAMKRAVEAYQAGRGRVAKRERGAA